MCPIQWFSGQSSAADAKKLLKQGYFAPRLKSSLQKLYGRHHNLVDRYTISISQMTMDLNILRRYFLSSFTAKTLTDLIVYTSNMAGVIEEAGTAFPLRAPEFAPGFWWGTCCSLFLFSWVVLLCVFMFWVPCCDVCYDFHIKTMFGSPLPPVVLYEGSCLIYVICVCLCIVVCDTYCVVFLFCFYSSCVPYVASFSGLFIFDCPSFQCSLTFIFCILMWIVKTRWTR